MAVENSFKTAHSNITPIEHSTKLPGYTTAKSLHTNNDLPESYSTNQIDDNDPEGSASQVLKTPTLLM